MKKENNMSEEEIIKYIKDEIENEIDTFHWFDNTPKNETRRQIEESIKAHQGLLDLYNNTKKSELILANKFQKVNIELNKEKEKNKKLEEKIKKAIKEYNKPILDVLDRLPIMPRTIERGCGAKDGIIYVLQELLEEGE
jgi:uncharacterized protein YktB (UPF0637 family)